MYNVEKQARNEQILLSLKRLDFLSRSQIQKLHNLGGVRNANRVMKELELYVSHFREHENIYYLSAEGRKLVQCEKIRKRTPKVYHYLMRNDLYIFFGRPATWTNEVKVKLKDAYMIADALFHKDKLPHIIEIDHEQDMSENRKKIEFYKSIPNPIRLIYLTTTEYRRKKIMELCNGVDHQIYTVNDIL